MKTKKISDFGGVANKMPIFSSFFMLFSLANSGLPGTSGFVGEFFVILSSFKVNFWYSFFSGMTLILGAAYTLWMYKRVMLGNISNDSVALLNDLYFNEKIIFILLGFFVILLGIFPKPFLDFVHVSVEHLVIQIMQSKI